MVAEVETTSLAIPPRRHWFGIAKKWRWFEVLTGVLQLLLWLSGAPWKQCRKLAESPIYIGLQQLRNHIIWVYLHSLFLQAIDRHLCISESRRGVLPSFEKTASKSTSCLGKYVIYIYIEWASAQVPPTPLYLGGTVGRERERDREGEGEGEMDGWMDR